eukprot:364693-Chlamydomonas_euryale.AAC.3
MVASPPVEAAWPSTSARPPLALAASGMAASGIGRVGRWLPRALAAPGMAAGTVRFASQAAAAQIVFGMVHVGHGPLSARAPGWPDLRVIVQRHMHARVRLRGGTTRRLTVMRTVMRTR